MENMVVIVPDDDGDEDGTTSESSDSESDSSEFLSDDESNESAEESEHEYMERGQNYSFNLFRFQEIGPFTGPSPKARSGHRIVYYKGNIYSFGGYNPKIDLVDPEMVSDEYWRETRPLFKELWRLNLATRTWTKLKMEGKDIPEELASHTAVLHPAYRGCMIVYGGTGSPFGRATSNNVVVCNLETGRFSKLPIHPNLQQPMSLYGQAVVVEDNGMLYSVGGTSGINYFMDVHRLDLSESPPVWELLCRHIDTPDTPKPRYRHEICCYNNKLYILGGGTSLAVYGFENIPTFCLESRTWSFTRTKPDESTTIDRSDGNGFPEARRCHGAVRVGSQLFVFGGYDGDDIFGDIWRLELTSLEWSRLPQDLPVPVYFHAATVTEEGKLILFGGVNHIDNNSRTARVYTSWLKIPPLRALAWEAVQHYIPKIQEEKRDVLTELGVPQDCAESVQFSEGSLASCG